MQLNCLNILNHLRGQTKYIKPTSGVFTARFSSTAPNPNIVSHELLEGTSDEAPILLAHGVLGNKRNFNILAKKLAKETQRSIITYDARNHGNSFHSDIMGLEDLSKDAINLLDELKIEQCVFIGHSMGGRTALYTALTYPNRIEKLISVDSSPGPITGSNFTERGSILSYVEAMQNVNWGSANTLSSARKTADEQLTDAVPNLSVRQFILTNVEETSPSNYKWRVNLDAIQRHLQCTHQVFDKNNTKTFTGKTLFLGGGLSNYIRYEDYPNIKRLFPNCNITHIPDSGHWVHSEKPKEFLSAVTSFLGPEEINLF
ncbi:sn-1-specific diacylglycerol lipase ABHD11 [Ciona intestinalis]